MTRSIERVLQFGVQRKIFVEKRINGFWQLNVEILSNNQSVGNDVVVFPHRCQGDFSDVQC
ncbi:MAG: hypothetical protein BZY80_05405 [SAR202 cluster bacterium Io17-Chloro-G2]|nr:MAG: hypothetical protein BZY80_05405 [SAR202 cluster bacterium Io17-Chloro-G2]